MKCLMPENQRQVIADAIEGRRYVEWGMGGTSVWLAENAKPESAVSIEHHQGWLNETRMALPDWWRTRSVKCTPGQNATIGEEYADDAGDYVFAGIAEGGSVYLIDGVVRAKCLRALMPPPNSDRKLIIFLHDTQRDWYDDAIAYAIDHGFTRTDYPEGDDYPGCLLTKLERCS